MNYNLIYDARSSDYLVQDADTFDNVFRSASKSEAIAESQRLNKLLPIDGDERTYAEQRRRA